MDAARIALKSGKHLTTASPPSHSSLEVSSKMVYVAQCPVVLVLIYIILTLTCNTVGEDDFDGGAFQAGNQQNVQFGPAKRMRCVYENITPNIAHIL